MNTRIAIIDSDKCKPNKCGLQCKKFCPVNLGGKLCIEVNKQSKNAIISESLCIGCNACVKKCPFNAIRIINLVSDINLSEDIVQQFGSNGFRLFRLPLPSKNKIIGLLGANGIGKSTALKILGKKSMPNLGRYNNDNIAEDDIVNKYQGSELRKYLHDLYNGDLYVSFKPQNIHFLANNFEGTTQQLIDRYIRHDDIEDGHIKSVTIALNITPLLDKRVRELSGGELQRVAIAIAISRNANVYIIDEPTNFLDIKQRMAIAHLIKQLKERDEGKYVLVTDHDLSILDYLSDYIHVLYGKAGAYGIISQPLSTAEGINQYLSGFIIAENVRIRNSAITFDSTSMQNQDEGVKIYRYEAFNITQGSFSLTVPEGSFKSSHTVVLLGENGTGKTTCLKQIIKSLEQKLMVSYKPQYISFKYQGMVKDMLYTYIRDAMVDPVFISDIIKPFNAERLYDLDISTLSGGEMQLIAIVICLGRKADIYILDEPSAFLDIEHRIAFAKIFKHFILQNKRIGFIVEHDFTLISYLADSVMLFSGEPGVECIANNYSDPTEGINTFLKSIDVSTRRDKTNNRLRINKPNSQKDKQAKTSRIYV